MQRIKSSFQQTLNREGKLYIFTWDMDNIKTHGRNNIEKHVLLQINWSSF